MPASIFSWASQFFFVDLKILYSQTLTKQSVMKSVSHELNKSLTKCNTTRTSHERKNPTTKLVIKGHRLSMLLLQTLPQSSKQQLPVKGNLYRTSEQRARRRWNVNGRVNCLIAFGLKARELQTADDQHICRNSHVTDARSQGYTEVRAIMVRGQT